MRTWTTKENKFLRKAYNNEPISKIAKTLMRSVQSIRNHVHILRKKGFAFDRVGDVKSVSEISQDELEPIVRFAKTINQAAERDFFKGEKFEYKYEHPTQHDESDDIEAAKRFREERIEATKRRKNYGS
jgi:transposase